MGEPTPNHNDLAGKRYINLVRCSTDAQTETSIPAQLELLNAFAAVRGMVHVDDVELEGVSGSKPGNREDLTQIVDRKRTRNDFDVLLVQTEDRLTRGGANHGAWVQYELARHGILVVFASSDAPEGAYGDIIRTLKFQAAEETVKATSLRSTQGSQRALENGHVTTSSHTPYGTHRLYLSAMDKELFIIRDNRDGTQDKLDLKTRAVFETYGEIGQGARGHYRKQKSEKVLLVPGETDEVAVVRRIFQRKYIDGIGGRRIAHELNREGITAPNGGRWTQRQVDVIAENEIYTSTGVANRTSAARFHQRSKGHPQPVHLDPTVVAMKKTLPVRLRPSEDWVCREQPYLKDFLPEPLRSIAAEKIRQLWTDRCQPGRPKRPYNPHPDSDYLLTGLLTAVQDGRRLKGYTSGPTGRPVRYYVHPIAQKDPVLAGFPNKLFRADVLETAVLAVVSETLLTVSNLHAEVEAAVRMAMEQQSPPRANEISRLKEQRAIITQKINAILDMISVAEEEAKSKIFFLKNEQRQIDEQLRRAAEDTEKLPQDPAALIASIIDRLKNLSTSLDGLPTYQLRQVLAALIGSATIDMASGEVQIELRVPPMALSDAQTAIETLSLRQTSASPMLSQTQLRQSLVFARIDCKFMRLGKQHKPCFKCTRRAA